MIYSKSQSINQNMVLFQLAGNFYRAYGDSAKILSLLTGYKLLPSKGYGCRCGFPANGSGKTKVIEILKEKQIGFVFYNGETQGESYEGKPENYINAIKAWEESGAKIQDAEKPTPKIPVANKEDEQKVAIVSSSGISLEDALAQLKSKIETLINEKNLTIDNMVLLNNPEATSISSLIIYR